MKLNAMAGALASLEAGCRLAEWDGETHDLVRIFNVGDDNACYIAAGVCSCGLRIDGVGPGHVRKLHNEHAERRGDERWHGIEPF